MKNASLHFTTAVGSNQHIMITPCWSATEKLYRHVFVYFIHKSFLAFHAKWWRLNIIIFLKVVCKPSGFPDNIYLHACIYIKSEYRLWHRRGKSELKVHLKSWNSSGWGGRRILDVKGQTMATNVASSLDFPVRNSNAKVTKSKKAP